MLCATTSCSSRAMRIRSSVTRAGPASSSLGLPGVCLQQLAAVRAGAGRPRSRPSRPARTTRADQRRQRSEVADADQRREQGGGQRGQRDRAGGPRAGARGTGRTSGSRPPVRPPRRHQRHQDHRQGGDRAQAPPAATARRSTAIAASASGTAARPGPQHEGARRPGRTRSAARAVQREPAADGGRPARGRPAGSAAPTACTRAPAGVTPRVRRTTPAPASAARRYGAAREDLPAGGRRRCPPRPDDCGWTTPRRRSETSMIESRRTHQAVRSTVAVDGLSFDGRPGRVTGFLGPNGAGKSTTMRMILGLDHPDGRAGPWSTAGRTGRCGAPLRAGRRAAGRRRRARRPQRAQPPALAGGEQRHAPGRVDEVLDTGRPERRRRRAGPAASRSACASGSASPPRCSATRRS